MSIERLPISPVEGRNRRLTVVDGDVVPPDDVPYRVAQSEGEDLSMPPRADVTPTPEPAVPVPQPSPEATAWPVAPIPEALSEPEVAHGPAYDEAVATIDRAIDEARGTNNPAIHISVNRFDKLLGRELSRTYNSVEEYILATASDYSTEEYRELLARGKAAVDDYEQERRATHPPAVRRVWNQNTGEFDEEDY